MEPSLLVGEADGGVIVVGVDEPGSYLHAGTVVDYAATFASHPGNRTVFVSEDEDYHKRESVRALIESGLVEIAGVKPTPTTKSEPSASDLARAPQTVPGLEVR